MKNVFSKKVFPIIRVVVYTLLSFIIISTFLNTSFTLTPFLNKYIPEVAEYFGLVMTIVVGIATLVFIIEAISSMFISSSDYEEFTPEYIVLHKQKFNFRRIFLNKNGTALDVAAVKWFYNNGILAQCYPLAEIANDAYLFAKEFEDIPLDAFGTDLSGRFQNLALTFDDSGCPQLINSNGKYDYGIYNLARRINYNTLLTCNTTRNLGVLKIAYGKNLDRFKELKVPYKSLYNFIWAGVVSQGGSSAEVEKATRFARVK